MPQYTGALEGAQHPQITEALKTLAGAQDSYARACASIDGQYLKALDVALAPQVAAVRALFNLPTSPDVDTAPVRARFAAPVTRAAAPTPAVKPTVLHEVSPTRGHHKK